jgi:ribosome-associated protein
VDTNKNDAPHRAAGEVLPEGSVSDLVATAITSLEDAKAEDIVSIDLAGRTPLADHMIIASGRSDRHVGAIADHLIEALKKAGCRELRTQGLTHCDWVLIDGGDLIVHIFRPEVREFYNLEKLWSANAPTERLVG